MTHSPLHSNPSSKSGFTFAYGSMHTLQADGRMGYVDTLILATNHTSADAICQMERGELHRIDYVDLATKLRGTWVDYSAVPKPRSMQRRAESVSRLDYGQARMAAQMVEAGGYSTVFSMSERVGIPIAHMLPRGTFHVVNAHHLMSKHKLRVIKLLRVSDRWDRLIVYSEAEASQLRTLLPKSSQKIVAIPDKVDTVFWQPQPESGNVAHPHAYAFSAGLTYRDYTTYASALRLQPQVAARVQLGSSWVSNNGGFDRAAVPPNMQIRTTFLSTLELRDVYQASRFVVVPLRPTTLWNAGSNAVLEAQSMGKAVIATRTPNMEMYVRDGVTGLLVPPEDPHALAAAMRTLWDDPALCERMGRCAREWVLEHFTFDSWINRVASLLQPSVQQSAAIAVGQLQT